MPRLCEQLRHARQAAGLTQAELGAALKWADHTHVSAVERGRKDTTLDAIDTWAAACGHRIALVPVQDAAGGEHLAAVLAELGSVDRDLLLRLVAVLPWLDGHARERLDADVRFLERTFRR